MFVKLIRRETERWNDGDSETIYECARVSITQVRCGDGRRKPQAA